MEHHQDKVQAAALNHHLPQVLLSGSFDHYIIMKGRRVPSHSGFRWSVMVDLEILAWDPHTEHSFVVCAFNLVAWVIFLVQIFKTLFSPIQIFKTRVSSLLKRNKRRLPIILGLNIPSFDSVSFEDGSVRGFDIRAAKSDKCSESQLSFTLHAHDKAVCTVSYGPAAPNVKPSLIPWPDYLSLYCNIVLDYSQLLVTESTDKMVKIKLSSASLPMLGQALNNVWALIWMVLI
ncbi:hypothetical protein SLEP1_g31608 [Rubroshorea leprosula]|uniref:Uncharacterized protein n=1 Tax=Rubroshorea leprosula TaxID=152421 RepID=A0AAV5KAM3_9ROSI|nr:hypothetical protein SLEP1_g31608 [Rubroshorea leprosula]